MGPIPALRHPLFTLPSETGHVVSKAGRAACESNEDLMPGLNCCAVCADAAAAHECPHCHKVLYCGEAHAQRDAPRHKEVCALLAAMAAAEEVQLSHEEQAQHIASCMVTLQELQESDSWADVLPAEYTVSVDGDSDDEGDEDADAEGELQEEGAEEGDGVEGQGAGHGRPSKRACVDAQNDAAAADHAAPGNLLRRALIPVGKSTDAPGAAAAEIQAEGAAAGDAGAAAAADAVGATAGTQLAGAEAVDPELQDAVQVAIISSYLSYPYTLGYAMSSAATVRQAVAAVPAGSPLVVLVLGAADTAELCHMDVWKALEGACPGGVVLQMVGPEVPLSRHMQVEQITPGIQAAFYKGEYNALADHVLIASSPLAHLPALTKPGAAAAAEPGAASQAGQASDAPAAEAATATSVLPAALRALPDVVVGYNQGLTCPDYDWQPTIKAMRKVFKAKCDAAAATPAPSAKAAKAGMNVWLPWLQTSNTQLEGLMEEEVMRRAGWSVARPPARNPFTSLEPLQSGTLANDLYRKNAWVTVFELRARVSGRAGPKQRGTSLTSKLGGWAKAIAKAFTGGKRKRQ